MPPNPWKLLRTLELTQEQRRDLKQKLQQREDDLRKALEAVENALTLINKALAQGGGGKSAKKKARKPKRG